MAVGRWLARRPWLVLPGIGWLALVSALVLGLSRRTPPTAEPPTSGSTATASAAPVSPKPVSPSPGPTPAPGPGRYYAEVTFNAPYEAAVPGVGSIPYPFVTYYIATRDQAQYKELLALDASGNGVWEVNAVASIPPEWKVSLCTRGPATTVWSTVDWGSKSAALQYCDGSFAPDTWPKATSDCKATWGDVSAPSMRSDLVSAVSIATVSPTDVWAAEELSGSDETLMAHFDGSSWTTQPGPPHAMLSTLAPTTTNDIWAVGFSSASSATAQALIEHYDGMSWRAISGASLNGVSSRLSGITRVPHRNELWAVGEFSTGTATSALIEHYNGKTWVAVTSPNPGSSSSLSSVSADATNDVWAVGQYIKGKLPETLIEHYDGTRWSIVSSPNEGAAGNWLTGVVALSPANAWAVGESDTGTGGMPKYGLIEHYDGTGWTVATTSPLPDSILFGIAASSATDVWAVGRYQHTDAVYWHTLLEHFDGSNWTVVPTPYIEMTNGVFTNVDSFPQTGTLWLVGTTDNSLDNQPATFSQPLIQGLTWGCLRPATSRF